MSLQLIIPQAFNVNYIHSASYAISWSFRLRIIQFESHENGARKKQRGERNVIEGLAASSIYSEWALCREKNYAFSAGTQNPIIIVTHWYSRVVSACYPWGGNEASLESRKFHKMANFEFYSVTRVVWARLAREFWSVSGVSWIADPSRSRNFLRNVAMASLLSLSKFFFFSGL